jgi:acetylornithine deacetylase/succinyl-diaminopimelate desuccinylase-like protein
MYARAMRALLRDTVSPDMLHAGTKYNVIPGEAELIVDCRLLPETDEPAMRADVERRLGDLLDRCEIDLVIYGPPVESPVGTPLYELLEATILAHDPRGVPLPGMPPFATDAKHLARLGVPTYGFSPLRLEPGERFLERFHGVDERVGIDALRWGLPVLYDAVRGFCA